jgi:hypothetical protein
MGKYAGNPLTYGEIMIYKYIHLTSLTIRFAPTYG